MGPLGDVEFPGIMGWMQRNGRLLFLFGIVLMILSVGAGALSLGVGNTPVDDGEDPTPTATASETPSGSATPEVTADPIVRQYAAAPAMTIDQAASYRAVIHVEGGGQVELELLASEAPEFVNNFVFLAQNRFYDGLTFHRVDPGFVAQAGDPTGTSTGGPGYTLGDEDNELTFAPGSLSMARSAAGTSGSQFFITLGETPHLNADFTVFGRVISGMDVLEQLTPRDPSQSGQARGTVIESIEIVED